MFFVLLRERVYCVVWSSFAYNSKGIIVRV